MRLCISCGQPQRISRNCPLYKTGERTHQPWEVQFAQIRRITLTAEATFAGNTPEQMIGQILEDVPAPTLGANA